VSSPRATPAGVVQKAKAVMSERNHHDLIEYIKNVQCMLTRHFHDREVHVYGHAWNVEDVVELLEQYLERLEHEDGAAVQWFEASEELDDHETHIRPLLSAVHDLIAGEPQADPVDSDLEDADVDEVLRFLED
jgi:hypothetical protein